MSEVKRMVPLAGNVIVLPDLADKISSGGIILLASVNKTKSMKGEVIAAAAGCVVKKGDAVWFNPNIGTRLEEGKDTYLFLKEEQCLACLPATY